MSADNSTTAGGYEIYCNADDDDIDELIEDVLTITQKKPTKYTVKMLYDYCISMEYDPEQKLLFI